MSLHDLPLPLQVEIQRLKVQALLPTGPTILYMESGALRLSLDAAFQYVGPSMRAVEWDRRWLHRGGLLDALGTCITGTNGLWGAALDATLGPITCRTPCGEFRNSMRELTVLLYPSTTVAAARARHLLSDILSLPVGLLSTWIIPQLDTARFAFDDANTAHLTRLRSWRGASAKLQN